MSDWFHFEGNEILCHTSTKNQLGKLKIKEKN